MKRIIIIAAVLVVAAALVWHFSRNSNSPAEMYRFVQIERGDLESVVSATGALEAVTTVQVGTQVSGSIAAIYVDFNDRVEKNQVIARIDTTLLSIAVRDARAKLEKARADFAQYGREYKRAQELHEQQMVADTEVEKALYNLDSARASMKSAQIELDRAVQNLGYATIRAPISGTVIERNVDVGQTVAASFSAPQLFLIANDLSQMHILASVDESDIGQIREGQEVRFTVQAYPEKEFSGSVKQVRLQSATQENVVTYTVVIAVENGDGSLLPGMTATVDFLIERETDVLTVSNAALRFTPSADALAAFRERMRARRAARPSGSGDTAGGRGSDGTLAGRAQGHPGFGGARGRADGARLWYIDEAGELAVAHVTTGITDGQTTVVEGPAIAEGMQVIAGVSRSSQQNTGTNPFQSQQSGRRGPPHGPGF